MWSRTLTLVVRYKTEKNSYHECMMHDGLQRLFVRMHDKIGYYIIIFTLYVSDFLTLMCASTTGYK